MFDSYTRLKLFTYLSFEALSLLLLDDVCLGFINLGFSVTFSFAARNFLAAGPLEDTAKSSTDKCYQVSNTV